MSLFILIFVILLPEFFLPVIMVLLSLQAALLRPATIKATSERSCAFVRACCMSAYSKKIIITNYNKNGIIFGTKTLPWFPSSSTVVKKRVQKKKRLGKNAKICSTYLAHADQVWTALGCVAFKRK